MNGGIVTYVNANGIPTLVRFDRDRQAAYTFDVREWEVGLRALRPMNWQREAEGMAVIRRAEARSEAHR